METLIRIQRTRRSFFDYVTSGPMEFRLREIASLTTNPANVRFTWDNSAGTISSAGDAVVTWSTNADPNFASNTRNIVNAIQDREYGYGHYKREQPRLFTASGNLEWWDRLDREREVDDDDDDHALVKT